MSSVLVVRAVKETCSDLLVLLVKLALGLLALSCDAFILILLSNSGLMSYGALVFTRCDTLATDVWVACDESRSLFAGKASESFS